MAETRAQRKDIAKLASGRTRIDGRLIELSARVPSIWTIVAVLVSLSGESFVLIRVANCHCEMKQTLDEH